MLAIVDSSDGDLARAVAARTPGEAEAAEGELCRRLAPRVRLYGLRHLRDEDAALDLMQQVMLLTIEKLRSGAIRDTDQIGSFVLGVSRSMVKDQKRLEWRREKLRDTFMHPAIVEPPPESPALDLDSLERCLARLQERDRLVLMLTVYAERTAGEVAAELSLKEGNVRVIRHRAIERLRACMASAQVEP
jgi:RNA polymerase sigma-70 factor (ECF subfamily)